jgi:ABC-type proline/glycine betaine transport system permease subunit
MAEDLLLELYHLCISWITIPSMIISGSIIVIALALYAFLTQRIQYRTITHNEALYTVPPVAVQNQAIYIPPADLMVDSTDMPVVEIATHTDA